MGDRLVVLAWTQTEHGFADVVAWRGRSFLRAALAMWRAKRGGVRCIRLEWRP